jgi:serine/threonine protein phosphatase PrpC
VFVNSKPAGKTDVGLVRSENEDFLLIDRKNAVYVVCDGMGGHQAGEVASQGAAETIRLAFQNFSEELTESTCLPSDLEISKRGQLLINAVRVANRHIFTQAKLNPSQSGMGTTVVATAFEDDCLSIAHVGDSRVYRLEKDELVPLTVDHSWVSEIQRNSDVSEAEASNMVGKNVITRALGVRRDVEVDYRMVKVKPGDVYILCSDGLCGFATDDEIFDAVKEVRLDVDAIVENLIKLANDKGGQDNVTIIAVEIPDVKKTDAEEIEPFTCPAESDDLMALEDQWLAMMAEARQELQEQEAESGASGSSSSKGYFLFAIFGLFIVLGAVIIYLTAT